VGASDNAWATVSAAGPRNDRATSWTKSQNILCALSGTSPCTFPSVPEATRPSFTPEITPTVVSTCRAEIIAAEQADKVEKAQKETQSKESTAKQTKIDHRNQAYWVNLIGAETAQSSNYENFPSSKAVDGGANGYFGNNFCSHTQNQQNAWWRVTLPRDMEVQVVRIYNRVDCCQSRLSPFDIRISTNGDHTNGASCAGGTYGTYGPNFSLYSFGGEQMQDFDCANQRDAVTLVPKGRYVTIVLGRSDYLTLCEVMVFAYQV